MKPAGNRSYNLLMSRRGLDAIEGAGITLPPVNSYTQATGSRRFSPSQPNPIDIPAGPWTKFIGRQKLAEVSTEGHCCWVCTIRQAGY